ncbi:MAG: SpoVR family protein, partial [Alphaproteobacteria bacterium]
MSQIPHYERPEEEQEYYQDLVKLLDHYEDGWNLLIKAHKENNYDYPLPVKEEHKDNPYIPTTWLALADQVIQTIALKKYELDVFPNTIEIIRPDQMLDAYTTIGLPDTYPHWSFGKKRMIEERNFDASKHLAYEIVINSDPCLAYCMDSNSPLLQMIVIAHASYGHNTVFKNNFLLNEADASTILAENKRLRDFVLECEQTYGWKEVSDFIDFCHSMKFIDTTDEPKRPAKSPSEIARQQKEQRLAQHLYKPRQDQFNSAANENGKNPSPKQLGHPRKGEKNILAFMADHAPHMPGWKRDIMRSISRLSQYFKPQMMDKVLNEGMATFTHDRIMTTMRDIGLIDWAMYQEYKQINEGVLYQPSAVQLARDEHGRIVVDEDGNPQEQFVGAQFNPYTLGFKVLEEIERICKNPTDEDKEWFHFAGEPDWLSVVKHAVFSSSDETFIHNYLSPQAMRDLRMFKVENMDEDDYSEELQFLSQMYNVDFAQISAVQKGDGFRKMREQLAADYRIADKLPNITLWDYQEKTDRCLILRH